MFTVPTLTCAAGGIEGIDGRVDLYEIGTGQYAGGFGPTPKLTSIVFSSDGLYVCAGTMDGVVMRWETVGGVRKSIHCHHIVFVMCDLCYHMINVGYICIYVVRLL